MCIRDRVVHRGRSFRLPSRDTYYARLLLRLRRQEADSGRLASVSEYPFGGTTLVEFGVALRREAELFRGRVTYLVARYRRPAYPGIDLGRWLATVDAGCALG